MLCRNYLVDLYLGLNVMTHLTVWSLAIFRYWITNGAQHAKHCVVFAQLHSEGQNHGIHGVLVRIRDDSLKTMPGVTVEDMGYKMGLNGVENAKLSFDNVRVPRENLLNRYRVLSLKTYTLYVATESGNYSHVVNAPVCIING